MRSSKSKSSLTVKKALQLLVEELLLCLGGDETGGAEPDRVDEPHAVELQLLPAALAAKDLPAAATVVLKIFVKCTESSTSYVVG